MDKHKKLEMGYTPAEFKKALLGQFSSNSLYTVEEMKPDNYQVAHEVDSIKVEITLKVAPPRKIAMLTLPVLDTQFYFSDFTEVQQKEFFRVFFKYFHKGGG